MQARFARLAMQASVAAGSAWMFLGTVLAFGVWLLVGCFLGWTDATHLWPTSLLTWLTMGFVVLIQHSQSRQEAALQAKLDAVIFALDKADNQLIGVEKRPPDAGGRVKDVQTGAMMGVRAWVWVVLGCFLTVGVLASWKVVAQQPPLSCEQSLKEMDFKRNAEMLQNRTLTDAFARELRVAVERAEKAEQALAQAKAAASEAAKPSPVKSQE